VRQVLSLASVAVWARGREGTFDVSNSSKVADAGPGASKGNANVEDSDDCGSGSSVGDDGDDDPLKGSILASLLPPTVRPGAKAPANSGHGASSKENKALTSALASASSRAPAGSGACGSGGDGKSSR
jgi:hypothetical protein